MSCLLPVFTAQENWDLIHPPNELGKEDTNKNKYLLLPARELMGSASNLQSVSKTKWKARGNKSLVFNAKPKPPET